MRKVADARQMQKIDAITIEELKIPSMVLMERAALKVSKAIYDHTDFARCLIVVGTGNNGGDGIAVARQLLETKQEKKPRAVFVLVLGNPETGSESFRAQYAIARQMGIPFLEQWPEEGCDLIVDAIFGVGLSRAVEGTIADTIHKINQSGAYVVAVDVPSGIDSTSGRCLGCSVQADLTVTLGLLKTGLLLYPGCEAAGKVLVEEIGFWEQAVERAKITVHTLDRDASISELLPTRAERSNKGSYGRLLVIAGGKNMAGAACFSALAAYRTGCGLVHVVTHEANRQIVQTLVPEAVLTTYEESDSFDWLNALVEQADAIVAGPGMGTGACSKRLLEALFNSLSGGTGRATVLLDADALNLISHSMEVLTACEATVIVTPHLKEMSRLLSGVSVAAIADDLMGCALRFAQEYQVICVLKDAHTIVAESGGFAYINRSGNNGMATGGSGDVLTGIIGGLLAQHMEPYQAAWLGVFMHGRAGDMAQKRLGVYSITARDLAAHIPEVTGGMKHEDEQLLSGACRD